MSYSKCANCGGEQGIHHYQTDQCPVGGREARIGQEQEYKTSTFRAVEIPVDPPLRLAKNITVREHFAALAMQGLCADPNTWEMTYAATAESAVKYADALIEALNEQEVK